jgi:hypothetical protein
MSDSIDFTSTAELEAFSTEVDAALDADADGSAFWPLVVAWCAAGLVLTLAVRTEHTALYVIGIAATIAWVAGFVVHRDGARWYRW